MVGRSWFLAGEITQDAAHAWPLVRDALGHVMVTGAERLGGIALVVRFEVAASDAVRTLESLRAVMRITEGESIPSGDELFGHLHVTLAHDGPDERVEIPKVPG